MFETTILKQIKESRWKGSTNYLILDCGNQNEEASRKMPSVAKWHFKKITLKV